MAGWSTSRRWASGRPSGSWWRAPSAPAASATGGGTSWSPRDAATPWSSRPWRSTTSPPSGSSSKRREASSAPAATCPWAPASTTPRSPRTPPWPLRCGRSWDFERPVSHHRRILPRLRQRQAAVSIVGRLFAIRHRIVGPILQPLAPLFVARVVLQVEIDVFLAPAPDQIDVVGVGRILRHEDGGLAQRVAPQIDVQVTIVQVIRVMEEGAELGEPVDDVPELPADLLIAQLIRRRQGDSRLRQEVEQSARLPLLVRGDLLQEQVVKIFRVIV